jgi:hypothetical protein
MGYDNPQDNVQAAEDYYASHADVRDVTGNEVNSVFASSLSPEAIPSLTKLPRESRDVRGKPKSLNSVIIVDDTDSMDEILSWLISNGLESIAVKALNAVKNHDFQVLFGFINDIRAYCDNPLQIGQFEAGFGQMMQQLRSFKRQGNGGGNGFEGYSIAYHFAAKHTEADAFTKRGEKGLFICIGDDACTNFTQYERELVYGKNNLNSIRGTLSESEITNMASQKYVCYQIIVPGYAYFHHGDYVLRQWRRLLGNHAIFLGIPEDLRRYDVDELMKYDRPKRLMKSLPDLITTLFLMRDGLSKTQAISQIEDFENRRSVILALKDHEEYMDYTVRNHSVPKSIETF